MSQRWYLPHTAPPTLGSATTLSIEHQSLLAQLVDGVSGFAKGFVASESEDLNNY